MCLYILSRYEDRAPVTFLRIGLKWYSKARREPITVVVCSGNKCIVDHKQATRS